MVHQYDIYMYGEFYVRQLFISLVMVTSFKDLKKHKNLFITIPPILHRVSVSLHASACMYLFLIWMCNTKEHVCIINYSDSITHVQ